MSNIILSFKELNKLKSVIYATEVAYGFHDEKHTVDHDLGMVLSEIGEAISADRNPDAPTVTEATLEQALSSLAGDGYRPIDFMPSEVKMLRDAVLQLTKFKIDSKK